MFDHILETMINNEVYEIHFTRDSLEHDGDFNMANVQYSLYGENDWETVAGSEIEEALEFEIYDTEDPSTYQEIIEALHPEVSYTWDGREVVSMEVEP
jgi:hypothetical protein